MIRFKKIKITSDEKIHLEYERINKAGEWDEHSMKSSQAAAPSFYHTLDDLAPHVEEICELPHNDHQVHPYEIKGLSFSYAGVDEIMGVTITALRALDDSNSPLVLNTPHKTEESYSEGADDFNLLSTDQLIDIKRVVNEAKDYLDGKRAQGNLFQEDEKKEEVSA